jgi:non-heme chloroperoxidase
MQTAIVRLATGPRIHYAEHGARDGQPIILLHGWPDSWFSYSEVARMLPPGYRSFLLDQRGFGDSERPLEHYAVADFASDVVAFMDALSIPKATLVGHSFGSFVARQVAIAAPQHVHRLALIGSGWTARNAVTNEVQASIRALADPVPAAFASEFQASTICKPVPEAFFERLVAESCKLPARLWREVFDSLLDYDDRDSLSRIEVPTLLLWGERDALFSRDDQDKLAATIPRAELLAYAGIGHSPNWECPQRVADDIAAFVGR